MTALLLCALLAGPLHGAAEARPLGLARPPCEAQCACEDMQRSARDSGLTDVGACTLMAGCDCYRPAGNLIPMPLPEPPCDLAELLAAARAVEPFLPQPPCLNCLVITLDIYQTPLTEPQRLRAEADRLEAEVAATARLRAALAACKEKP